MLLRTPVAQETLGEAEADALFACLDTDQPALLAVSGGPDSTALMGLAAGWAHQHGAPLPVVAVVDHRLRHGSTSEAESVLRMAAGLGLEGAILTWEGVKPVAGVQEQARLARYDLLASFARQRGLRTLVTGHTLDDQAETVLMRLAHGSGPAGLAGMRRETRRDGLRHVRPFLDIPKTRLIATCDAHGWPWLTDPSNRDERFERVRWRQLMPLLAAAGLDAARLGLLARRLGEADEVVEAQALALLQHVGRPDGALDFLRLRKAPRAVVIRALGRWLEGAGSVATPPQHWKPMRLARLETLAGRLDEAAGQGLRLTANLAGLVLGLNRQGILTCRREVRRRGNINPVPASVLGKGRSDD